MSRLRLSTGLLWVFLPLGLLSVELYLLAASGFDNWPRFVIPALIVLFVSACGLYFLLAWPGSTWVLRAIATVVSLYFLFMALEAADQGPGQPLDWTNASLPLVVVAFGIFSVIIARRA